MADISKITTLDGTTYDIKDSTARDSIPSVATTAPIMDGTAAVGSSTKYAREDHVHPTDTSRAPTSHASSATTYGQGNASNYGHVKVSDNYTSSAGAASAGVAASSSAVYNVYAKFANDILYFTGVTVSAQTSGGNFVSYSNSAITANHVLIDIQFANPAYVISDYTWTTSAGKIVINGTTTAATTCYLILGKKQN